MIRQSSTFPLPADCTEIGHTSLVAKRVPKSKPPKPQPAPDLLKGWQQIAAFLGQTVSVVQRWADEGMPVKREGRFVSTSPADLNQWLGRESGEPVHVATENLDLAPELKRGLSHVRKEKRTGSRRWSCRSLC